MEIFELVSQYFARGICLCVYSVNLHNNDFFLQSKLSNHDSYFLFCRVYFLRKWEQILDLFSFLLKMANAIVVFG